MTSLLMEAVKVELGATERWPDNVKLFQQYQVEQITFPDYAACLSVKTYLHMCGLNFTTELKINAEEMSPSGKVPFIQIGPFLISEMEPIISAVQTRGFTLSADLPDIQKSELKAYMSLVGNTLVNAELYLAWIQEDVYEQVTRERYGCMQPWPLNRILPCKKYFDIKRKLSVVDWLNKSFNEVCEEVITCCEALSERLGTQDFFFGKKPTELDALVFGHLFTLLTTDLPNKEFAQVIGKYDNLVQFCKRVDQKYYKQLDNDY
ncbi:metaxin-2-like [Mya arenaria]|uniref:metaxin-2-like n=1 Tax=Mya arenaria TaxID=6604 RepID=UPI0022E1FD15|nr:metaxin-2-like [Mya arenaria]